jgi:hypothetical protein
MAGDSAGLIDFGSLLRPDAAGRALVDCRQELGDLGFGANTRSPCGLSAFCFAERIVTEVVAESNFHVTLVVAEYDGEGIEEGLAQGVTSAVRSLLNVDRCDMRGRGRPAGAGADEYMSRLDPEFRQRHRGALRRDTHRHGVVRVQHANAVLAHEPHDDIGAQRAYDLARPQVAAEALAQVAVQGAIMGQAVCRVSCSRIPRGEPGATSRTAAGRARPQHCCARIRAAAPCCQRRRGHRPAGPNAARRRPLPLGSSPRCIAEAARAPPACSSCARYSCRLQFVLGSVRRPAR